VRKLCPSCAVPDTTHPLLRKIGPRFADADFRAPAGCISCRQVGYKGRMGVFEMLRMTPAIQALLEHQAPSSQVLQAARADGMRSLFEDGLDRAAQALTSLDEVASLRSELAGGESASETRAAA